MTPSHRHDGSKSPQRRVPLPRYDQNLQSAKNAQKVVRFSLSVPTCFTDDEGEVTGLIVEVDKFNVKIELADNARQVWLAKLHIVGTEVLA